MLFYVARYGCALHYRVVILYCTNDNSVQLFDCIGMHRIFLIVASCWEMEIERWKRQHIWESVIDVNSSRSGLWKRKDVVQT